jgi:hypothetical protein
MGNDLRESTIEEKVLNGTGNSVFIRNEHELTSGTIQFVGEDKSYPSRKENLFGGVPTQNVFGPGNIYSDGGTYQVAVHVQSGSTNLWFANNLTSGSDLKVLIQLDKGAEVNTFSDNQIQMGSSDVPVVVNNGYLNQLRSGAIQVRAAPNPPCTTGVVNNSSMVIDKVRTNDNCFFTTISGTGAAANTYVTSLLNSDVAPFPRVFEANGTPVKNSHFVRGSQALSKGAAVVTLTGSAAFTDKGSFSCQAWGAHPATAANLSGTQFSISGSAGDTVTYLCLGN